MPAPATIISQFGHLRGASEKSMFIESQFRKAIDAHQKKRDRLYQNLEYYFGDGQIPDIQKAKADREGRELIIHNLSMRKVQGLVGSLLKNNFNITYMSIDGRNTQLIHALQDMLLADMNSGNWDYHWMQFLKLGLIEEAIMEMTTSTATSPLGNLVFECTAPGSVLLDPDWRTNNSADMTECFKYTYWSPSQLMEAYPDMSDKIKEAVLNWMQRGKDYLFSRSSGGRELWNAVRGGTPEGPSGRPDVSYNEYPFTTIGNQFRVIDYYYIEPTRSKKELDITTGIELPQTEDVAYKRKWIDANKINLDNLREIECLKRVVKVCTIVPDLLPSEHLQDKPHELQIGRMPFFPWSPERINGDVRSIVDTIKSLQDTLNKRENMLNNILENSANGACAIDPAIVDNDPALKDLIQQSWSNPKFKFWTSNGALLAGKNYFAQIPKTMPPNEIFAQINHLWEAIDRVIPVNAASDGRQESGHESGVLFSMKQNAVETAQATLVRGLMAALTEMGEAYFLAAKVYYSNVERKFVKPNGEVFSINEIIPLSSGDIGVLYDISTLQQLKTLVKMGQDSPNTRFTRRLTALDVLKLVPQSMPSVQVEVMGELLDTLDIDEDYKARLEAALDHARLVAIAQENAAKAAFEGQIAQAQAATQSAQAPPPGQPGEAQGQPGEPPQQGMKRALAALLTGGQGGPPPQGSRPGEPPQQGMRRAMAPLLTGGQAGPPPA